MIMFRNPFARTELRRFTVVDKNKTCAWCGQHRKRLYAYVVQNDGQTYRNSQRLESAKLFCNLDCYAPYKG